MIEQLHSVGNIRDLGGYVTGNGKRIKSQKIYRSACLHNLSEIDQPILKFVGVNKVIDFRDVKEQENEPDAIMPDTEYFLFPVFYTTRIPVINENFIKDMYHKKDRLIEFLFKQKDRMQKIYRDFVEEESALKAYHDFFEILLESDRQEDTVLFHCTAGKDRTGFAAALFLKCLGVDESFIIRDYMQTNEYLEQRIAETIIRFQSLCIDAAIIDEVKKYFLAQEDYLLLSFRAIEDKYGSFLSYLEKIGVNEKALAKLYNVYTE